MSQIHFSKVNWVNGQTPLNANNLNQMQDGIVQCVQTLNNLMDSIGNYAILSSNLENLQHDVNTVEETVSFMQNYAVNVTYSSDTATLTFSKPELSNS